MAATRGRSRSRAGQPDTVQVEADWSKGIIRDTPRAAIPAGGVYDAADFLLHEPGIAIKRGGTGYAGPAMSGASYAQGVAYAEFPAGSQIVAVSELGHGHIYQVTPGSTTDLGGTAVALVDKPKMRLGGGKNLLIFPSVNGTSPPVKYDGSAAPAVLGGSPSAGRYAAIYATRLVLGNKTGNENRLFFSPTPDIESTWNTATSWMDCDYAIRGLAALSNALIVFSLGHTERIIGTSPPPGSDMQRATIGAIGCTDARSIVVQGSNVLFANQRGVYLTNGAGFESLTGPPRGGIESYWQSLLSGYDYDTWVISAEAFGQFYVVSIIDNAGALVGTLMCYMPTRSWWRLTNIRASMMAVAVGAQEELYYADRATNRISKLSGIFTPSASNKNDANGTAVTPLLETRMLGHGPGLKHFGLGRLSFDMTDAATDNPTMAMSVAAGVAASSFAAVAESPFAENTDVERKRFTIAKQSQGVHLRLQQSGPSAKTEIYALEYEERPFALQRGGQ